MVFRFDRCGMTGSAPPLTRHGPICVAFIAFVGNDGAGRLLRPCVDQGLKHRAVGSFAAGQFECDWQPVMVCFQVDFCAETAA